MKSLKPVILLIVLILSLSGFNQSISGYVLDEANNPIPFSKVFVKDNVLNNTGAVADIEGKYSFAVPQGNYEIVYSSLGF
jgi:hypothetical protein